jgi:hypothetical protein
MNRYFILVSALAFLGCFMLIGTIVLGLISLVRPEWMFYTVIGPTADPSVAYTFNNPRMDNYSRWRGMFDVCLQNASSGNAFYVTAKPDAQRQQNCIEIELNNDRSDYTPFDWHIISMRRAHIALHIVGVFFGTVTFFYLVIALLVTCCNPRLKTLRCHLYIAGSMVFVGVLFYFCAFLTFHNIMDREKLAGSRYDTKLVTVLGLSNPATRSNTNVKYSSMYACAWTSLLCELVAVFLFFVPGMCCTYSVEYNDGSVMTLPLADSNPRVKNLNANETSFTPKSVNDPNKDIYADMALSRTNPVQASPPAVEGQESGNAPDSQASFVPMSRY